MTRLNAIDKLLMEIASAWGDVDDFVVRECDRFRDDLGELRKSITDARDHEEGRDPS